MRVRGKLERKHPRKYYNRNNRILNTRTQANIRTHTHALKYPHMSVSYDISLRRRPTDFDSVRFGRKLRRRLRYNKFCASECLHSIPKYSKQINIGHTHRSMRTMCDDQSIYLSISHLKLVFCFVEQNRIDDITHRVCVYWLCIEWIMSTNINMNNLR